MPGTCDISVIVVVLLLLLFYCYYYYYYIVIINMIVVFNPFAFSFLFVVASFIRSFLFYFVPGKYFCRRLCCYWLMREVKVTRYPTWFLFDERRKLPCNH